MVRIRLAGAGDLRFLHEMLVEAAYPPELGRPSVEEMLASPAIARYIADWGRHGDTAVVAVDERGRRLGAAWYRLFSSDKPGFGFVDTATPEITIAVLPAHRGQGIGSSLLAGLIDRARQEGFAALSLSVSHGTRQPPCTDASDSDVFRRTTSTGRCVSTSKPVLHEAETS